MFTALHPYRIITVVSNLNWTVKLLRLIDNQIVDAVLTTVTDKHLEDAKTLWEPLLQGTDKDDEYWDWDRKSRGVKILPGDELYAIECEGVTQGLLTSRK